MNAFVTISRPFLNMTQKKVARMPAHFRLHRSTRSGPSKFTVSRIDDGSTVDFRVPDREVRGRAGNATVDRPVGRRYNPALWCARRRRPDGSDERSEISHGVEQL